MTGPVIPPALKFWRLATALASGLAFLSGFLGTLFIPMVSCFECAMWILLAALVPGLFLLLPVCIIFRRVRIQR